MCRKRPILNLPNEQIELHLRYQMVVSWLSAGLGCLSNRGIVPEMKDFKIYLMNRMSTEYLSISMWGNKTALFCRMSRWSCFCDISCFQWLSHSPQTYLYQDDRFRNLGSQILPNEPNAHRILKHFNVGGLSNVDSAEGAV